MSRTYVIDHVNPDADSIAAAVGYAWLLRERDREDVVNAPPILDDLPYLRRPDGTFLAAGVVSRKKQLLPFVLGLLEE